MFFDMEKNIIILVEGIIKELGLIQNISDIPPVYLEIPKDDSHGELSLNIAMRVSMKAGRSPNEIASLIVDRMREKIQKSSLRDKIERLEIEMPGFINLFLSKAALWDILTEISKKGADFGESNSGRNKRVLIEFVSANPTGPLSVAHGRQAAVGDSLANILKFSGYDVSREYYINDEGSRIDILGSSVKARYLQLLGKTAEFPEDGYKGQYLYGIAKIIIDRYGDKKVEAPIKFFSTFCYKSILKDIKKDLIDFGVKFDNWISQAGLRKSGDIENTLQLLEKKGYVYKDKDALWLKSTEFGDDKDRVLIKSDGNFTYLTPDIAYHKDKYNRGFNMMVDLWGPDHHGYIPRIKAAISILGLKEEALSVLIIQLVTLRKEGKPIPMSTREGEYITLREVMDEVGKDAARFFFLMRKKDSHLDFDLELAKKESADNPVFYIQYAHARISSIAEFKKKKTAFKNGRLSTLKESEHIDFSLLDKIEELKLLKVLSQFPGIVSVCAERLEPYGLIPYLQNLATTFHGFYDKHRVISDNLALTNARLALVGCTRIVLSNGLKLLGISAPKKM